MATPVKERPIAKNGIRVEEAERITVQEFFKTAPIEGQSELIDGVIVRPALPFDIHERVRQFLLCLISLYVEGESLGELLGPCTPAVLNDYNAPSPDILFVANDGPAEIRREGVFGPPDLVIEILSAGTAQNDRGPKFLAYEEAGVRELWLIDPYGPAGTSFFQLEKGSFRPVQPNADQILKSVAISGFWIDVRWLWPGEEKFILVRKALEQILPSKPSHIQE